MFQNVYSKYGSYGLYRGFSTTYYSSTTAGYAFFAIYKGLKVKLKEIYQPKTQNQLTMIYLCASVVAETISLLMYYPYEMMKVRIIAKNDKYNYRSVFDGFRQVLHQDGVSGLYKGSQHFLANYVMSYSI